MSKYKEISAQTRQNLMDAFWKIYCEKRIEKITIREITTVAGYNRSTFYEYFTDVYDILEQIENSLLPEIEEMPPIIPSMDNPFPIDSFIKLYSNNGKYYAVLLGDNGDPAFAGKIKNGIKAKILTQLGTTSTENVELDYTLEYMISAVIGMLAYWFKNDENMPKEDLIKLMYSLMGSEEVKQLASKYSNIDKKMGETNWFDSSPTLFYNIKLSQHDNNDMVACNETSR